MSNNIMQKCKELDHILSTNQPFDRLDKFIKHNWIEINRIVSGIAYPNMLYMPKNLKKYSRLQLFELSKYATLKIIVAIVLNRELPDYIRAIFWHHLQDIYQWNHNIIYGQTLIQECKHIRKNMGVFDMEHFYSEKQRSFIRMTKAVIKTSLLSSDIENSLEKDAVSTVQITRMLHGKKLTITQMLAAFRYDAQKIILNAIEKNTDQFFKIHTPEDWLFIICNNFCNKTGLAAINAIAAIFPDVVKSAKDPWGANLLWNTFFCDNSYWQKISFMQNIQNKLIELGCDPDEKNELGLSFNLVMENSPDKWKEELGLCEEN